MAWDRYAYVMNSPVRYSDPSGHYVCEGALGCGSNTFSEEELVAYYVSVAERFPNEGYSGYAHQYFMAIATYHQALAINDKVGAEANLAHVISNHNALAINGFYGPNRTMDTAMDVGLAMAPQFVAEAATGLAGIMLSPSSYIAGLEGSNPDAHAWSKHGPYASDEALQTAAQNSTRPQTRFVDESEMASAVTKALTTNRAEIISRANSGFPGTIAYDTTNVSYSGFQKVGGEVVSISGQAPARVVFRYDGSGNWHLFTAYPKP